MNVKNYLALIMVLCCVGFVTHDAVIAATTGKIAGKIIDSDTNEPLPGANVVVQGTQMGAATDSNGKYVILNISPGIYTLRFSMMGYTAKIVENVRVQIDLTTRINIELDPTVLGGEEVTIVAERPLVQKDMTASMSSVGSQEIKDLPVQEVSDVLELQAGLVKSGNQFHIRGGRTGEVAYWVDGVATTDVFGGGMGVTVENSAVEELQVVSGTFNAEYGQAMSGIINIITKEGGEEYNGQIRGWVGDYISGADEFSVLKRVDPIYNDQDQAIGANGIKSYPLENFNPNYNFDYSLSGPIPFTNDNVTFFTNGRYVSNEGYLYGREWFTPVGTPGDSSLVPMNPSERMSLQGKLTWRPGSNLKLSYNAFWSDWHSERSYNQSYKYNPNGVSQGMGTSQTHIFTLNHVLSPTTFYELKINRFNNEYESYVFDDPHAKPHYLVHVYSDTVNGQFFPADTLDLSNQDDASKFENVKQQRINYNYFIDPNGPIGYISPDSSSTPVSYSFMNDGMSMGRFQRSTAYWVGKFDLSSQITKENQIKTGFEVRLHELELHSYTIRPKVDDESNEQIVPFEPSIPDKDTHFRSDYVREPREFSAYIQDKLELQDLIINAGLRFDYFDANYVKPTDPHDPNIYWPYKKEHIYKNWEDPPEGLSQPEMEEYIAQFEEYTPEERRDIMHTDVDPKMQLSPRLGIAYPITDQGVIHFSYGHFFQIPEFQYLYDNPDFKLSPQGGYTVFGNADLEPQKTVMYEIGLQQQITADIGIDVTLFYRDVRDWVGTSPLIDTPIPSVKYSQFENKDYENVRGITLKMEKRYSHNFSARLDYSFQMAEGSYSNPTDAFNAYQAQEEPRKSLVPMNWDQRHTLNGSIVYRLNKWTASLIGRFRTGRPYTPSFPRAAVVGGAALIGLKENSERLPNRKSVDLTLNRRFTLNDNTNINLFVNVYNLFDTRDETWVYTDTGSADYTTNITPERVSYSSQRIGTVEDYVNHPNWYTSPRQVQIGLSLDF